VPPAITVVAHDQPASI